MCCLSRKTIILSGCAVLIFSSPNEDNPSHDDERQKDVFVSQRLLDPPLPLLAGLEIEPLPVFVYDPLHRARLLHFLEGGGEGGQQGGGPGQGQGHVVNGEAEARDLRAKNIQ